MGKEWYQKNRKLGGFLLFFTILSFWGILTLFIQISSVSSSYSKDAIYNQYVTQTITIIFASIMFMIIRIVALFTRKKAMVILTIVSAPIISLISYVVTESAMTSLNQSGGYYQYSMPSGYGFNIFMTCLSAVLWTLYILNSQRCEVYFEKEETYNRQFEDMEKKSFY